MDIEKMFNFSEKDADTTPVESEYFAFDTKNEEDSFFNQLHSDLKNDFESS